MVGFPVRQSFKLEMNPKFRGSSDHSLSPESERPLISEGGIERNSEMEKCHYWQNGSKLGSKDPKFSVQIYT